MSWSAECGIKIVGDGTAPWGTPAKIGGIGTREFCSWPDREVTFVISLDNIDMT